MKSEKKQLATVEREGRWRGRAGGEEGQVEREGEGREREGEKEKKGERE